MPVTAEQWWTIHRLKERYGERVIGIQELALPLALLDKTASLLPYCESLDRILEYYLGERYFGPIDQLDALCSLAGKSVIEFGPLDGSQTAGLVKAGAARIVCIESRPENVLKTTLASRVFGWDHVQVVADDFHNADAVKYGRFDLAFAHGVYYHSIAPTLFLQNLLRLSDTIFVGGLCATEDRPDCAYESMAYRGRTYRVKPYKEHLQAFVAGVNETSYFFHGDDLMDFFRHQGCEVAPMSDEAMATHWPAGRYVRFVARRQSAG